MTSPESRPTPDKTLCAVCGLFCPACTLYIGTQDDPARLARLAQRMDRSIDELTCHGCRSEKRSFFCETRCKMVRCATEKGIDFCGACQDYPCNDLKEFQSQMPHRTELWESLKRIREVGHERWFTEMAAQFACPHCGTINSAYDVACRKCKAEPSSPFFDRHRDEILRHPAITRMAPDAK